MKRIHIERKIAHLQKVLSRHYPTHNMPPIIYIERDTDGNLIVPPLVDPRGAGVTGDIEHHGEIRNIEPVELEPELTDIPEDEINQREEEQKLLEEKLAQIELDKLVKKKPRVKK